jgi:flagellar biosynthesis/type III secretory pathway M-ring protein FliF/YscJ
MGLAFAIAGLKHKSEWKAGKWSKRRKMMIIVSLVILAAVIAALLVIRT